MESNCNLPLIANLVIVKVPGVDDSIQNGHLHAKLGTVLQAPHGEGDPVLQRLVLVLKPQFQQILVLVDEGLEFGDLQFGVLL